MFPISFTTLLLEQTELMRNAKMRTIEFSAPACLLLDHFVSAIQFL